MPRPPVSESDDAGLAPAALVLLRREPAPGGDLSVAGEAPSGRASAARDLLVESAGASLGDSVAGASVRVNGFEYAPNLGVGAKGAPPGSALERLAFTPVGVTLGLPAERSGVEIRDFVLR